MRGQESTEARIAKTQRGASKSSSDPSAQRVVAQYVDRYVGPLKADFVTVKERLERLSGIRGEKGDKAVTMHGFKAAKNITLEANMVSASPTASEHNALVRDIRRIRDALNRVE